MSTGCSGRAAAAALSPCICVQVIPHILQFCGGASLTIWQKYLTLSSAVDTTAALALAWARAIDACDTSADVCANHAPSSHGQTADDPLADTGAKRASRGDVPVLLLPDADILCPGDASDDALKLAAAFVAGAAAAAKRGVGVVATTMDQTHVSSSSSSSGSSSSFPLSMLIVFLGR
jgi:hypothetical protein